MTKHLSISKTGIEHLRLTNFRSYTRLSLDLDTSFKPVILTGGNGAGKTNILEAISFLVPGKGLRSARLSDLARQAPENTFNTEWAVFAKVKNDDDTIGIGTGCTKALEHRQIKIDERQVKNQSELGDVLSALWLTPSMDRLFNGDPASRRRFLDRLALSFNPSYATLLSDYSYAFKQWNTLLKERRSDAIWLSNLEDQIAENGVAIAATRKDIVARLSHFLNQKQDTLFPSANITLQGILEQTLDTLSALDVEDHFKDVLKKARRIVANGGSVAGPHTSDFSVLHREKGMDACLCSTGEQKALLISIILSQTKAICQEKGKCPLLLLDEITAHLDDNRKEALFDILLTLPTQVWMTGTEERAFASLSKKSDFFNIENQAAYKAVA